MAKKAARSGAKTMSNKPLRDPRASVGAAPLARGGCLVALELGAEWPGGSSLSLELEQSERRVIVQLEGEAPVAFAERVASGLDALFGRGVELRTLALGCNERTDATADEARRSLLGLALGAMARRNEGQVVLTASPRSGARLRSYLELLSAASRREWHSAGLTVSVDYGREAAPPEKAAPRARVA